VENFVTNKQVRETLSRWRLYILVYLFVCEQTRNP